MPPEKDNIKGAIWMIGSGVGYTVFLTFAKLLGDRVDPGFLAFFRSFFALLVTLPFVIAAGRSLWVTDRVGSIVLRSIAGTVGFLLSLYALAPQFGLPLSQFSAIAFSRTLFVVMLAAFVLREPVGPRRWTATLVGFVGVLIMLEPTSGIGTGSLLALGSAASFALAIIMVKSLSASHTALQLLTFSNVASCFLLLPLALLNWGSPSAIDWLLILAMATAGMIAQYCYITAMRIGDASFQAPMDYLRLPMTSVVDFVLFRMLPGLSIWIGAAVIVGSTLYITLREAMLNRAARPETRAGP